MGRRHTGLWIGVRVQVRVRIRSVDPILACTTLVGNIQSIVSRSHDPMVHAVVSVCSFQSGDPTAPNVIPETAELSGTVRTFSKHAQDLTEERLLALCRGIEASFGAELRLEYLRESPCVINAPEPAGLVEKAAQKVSATGVIADCMTMASEDMSFFLNAVPGCFFLIGSGGEGDQVLGHHTEDFDFHEDALLVGASVFVQLVEDLMVES
eukprot:TRINITY_DN6325_c0_g1_i3.p2 TRINITY_DN6325_c0_g1~~TRINITY_DN6325_c0_g1_i3.p2  ORF type:complete len:210 (+),score=41.49 TRINITY_DN6325_c0_g1_i3:891-1520(+)